MSRIGKKAACLLLCGALGATAVTGCSGQNRDNGTAVTVDGTKISMGVANFYARMQQATYETYYPSMMQTTAQDMWRQQTGEDKKETYETSTKASILQALEEMYLLQAHAKDYGVSVSDKEKEAIGQAADQFLSDNDKATLEKVSGTKENVEEVLTLLTISAKMQAAMTKDVPAGDTDEETSKKRQEAYTAALDEWKKDADIKVNKKNWDKISFDRLGVTLVQPKTEGASGTPSSSDEAGGEQTPDEGVSPAEDTK